MATTTARPRSGNEEKARLRMKNFIDDVIEEIENTPSKAAAKRSEKPKAPIVRRTPSRNIQSLCVLCFAICDF